jgi:hypothetical protein
VIPSSVSSAHGEFRLHRHVVVLREVFLPDRDLRGMHAKADVLRESQLFESDADQARQEKRIDLRFPPQYFANDGKRERDDFGFHSMEVGLAFPNERFERGRDGIALPAGCGFLVGSLAGDSFAEPLLPRLLFAGVEFLFAAGGFAGAGASA